MSGEVGGGQVRRNAPGFFGRRVRMGENFGNEMAETIDSSDENRSDLDESDGV